MNNSKRIALISCLVAAIGSFLPWATVTSAFGNIDIAGTAGDGQATVVFAILAAAFCYFGKSRGLMTGMIVCVLGAITSVNAIVQITDVTDQFDGTAVSVTAGIGVYLCAAGFIVAFITMLRTRRDLRSQNSEVDFSSLPQLSENQSMETGS